MSAVTAVRLCVHQRTDTDLLGVSSTSHDQPVSITKAVLISPAVHRLRIYNSPENLYFEARYSACREAGTAFYVGHASAGYYKDDDYLVSPRIVLNSSNSPSLHLLPPPNNFSSRLRTMCNEGEGICTSFAWLGYGTFLRQNTAQDFLGRLQQLGLTPDNYFTILAL